MEVTVKEQKRAEQLLQSQRIDLHQIESFSFMKRYHEAPRKSNLTTKDKYGPGVLTLHLKEGKVKVIYLPFCHHPSAMIRFLISKEVAFDNYAPKERTVTNLPTETFQRPSLYMFYFFVLFIMFLILGYYSISSDTWGTFILGAICAGLSLYLVTMLMTRFCYLSMDNDTLTIHSVGRAIRYQYTDLRKVNFDFSREQNFTHVMELLDKNYRYRLFYIGRVSRKKLNDIAERLLQAGVDATCSLNDNKRFYQDIQR